MSNNAYSLRLCFGGYCFYSYRFRLQTLAFGGYNYVACFKGGFDYRKERYRDTERNQKSNKNESTNQKQYESKKLEADRRHDMDKNIQKEVVEPPSHKWGIYVFTGLFICFILFITWYFRVGYKK